MARWAALGWRRRLLAVVVLVAVVGGSGTAALGYWTGDGDEVTGAGAARSATVGGGAVPTAVGSGNSSVLVTWGASAISNGVAVDGYLVRRYATSSGVEQPVGSGCSGRQAELSCTEVGVAAGNWRYTVTPAVGANWRGAESDRSGSVTTGPASLTLDISLFGPPLPAQTTGAVSGFAAGESITFTLDGGTAMPAAPGVVGADGTATITALAIPAVADGSHTVRVRGGTSGRTANAGIVIDTTPPTLTPIVTPPANANGWNRTQVEVSGVADDGGGSGISYVKVTNDGSDPRTSPTAYFFYGDPVPHESSVVIRFYGVDFAGNASAVQTLDVKIDTVAPTGVADVVVASGGAFVTAGTQAAPGVAYYRGAAAGSFRSRVRFTVDGGSPPFSLATSAQTGVSTGFTHTPGVTLAPDADGYWVTNLYSWAAGTTSSPVGTFTAMDAAGNTTVAPGSMINDSTPPDGTSVTALGLTGVGGRYSQSATLHLALTTGTDSASGLAGHGAQLRRASATLLSSDGVVSGVCGVYGAYAQVGAGDPGATYVDVVPTDNRCYRYAYTVPDHVGNVATATTGDIKVQTAPAAGLTPSSVRITPVTGLAAQYVSGSTVYYRPSLTGSFSVSATASDGVSGVAWLTFPAPDGFSGGGAVAPQGTGSTFTTTYSWSGNGAIASPGPQTLAAHDNAGYSPVLVGGFSIVSDTAGPVHVLSLTAATGGYLAGSTLYYNSNSSGSFRLLDTLADGGAGAASVTYPLLNLSGWSHAMEVVTAPVGGPYPSSTFSWSAHPSSPSTYAVTGTDNLGVVASTSFTFVSDQSPPSGGTITYPNGVRTVPSVPITVTDGTDTQSGPDPAGGIIVRDQVALNTTTEACGQFPNTFATTVTLVAGADTSVRNAYCYQYRYLPVDHVGNRGRVDGSSAVKIDTTPKLTGVASQQSGGGAGNGRLEVGDRLVLTLSESLLSAPTSFRSATEARAASGNVKLTIPGITNGALDTGSSAYLAGSGARTATFAGTVALANNGGATTLTLTVTSLTGSTTAVGSSGMTFGVAATVTGQDGTGATGTFTTASGFHLF